MSIESFLKTSSAIESSSIFLAPSRFFTPIFGNYFSCVFYIFQTIFFINFDFQLISVLKKMFLLVFLISTFATSQNFLGVSSLATIHLMELIFFVLRFNMPRSYLRKTIRSYNDRDTEMALFLVNEDGYGARYVARSTGVR